VSLRIVRLGDPRAAGERLRIGTVRRPPRGIPKSEYAERDIFDVWFPNLAPSEALLKEFFPVADDRAWRRFRRAFLAEMKTPTARRDLDLIAALSHHMDLSIGCYCAVPERCHRSLLGELLTKRNALIMDPDRTRESERSTGRQSAPDP